MKDLKNWDKKTWISSIKYISNFILFFKKQIKFNQEIKILDIGCGRAKIISKFSQKYRLRYRPVGIDIIRHKNISKKIRFIKINALTYLKTTKEKFDVILFKQSIHFFTLIEIKKILNFSKEKLNLGGQILILSLDTNNNQWPMFKYFKQKLKKSLRRDQKIMKLTKFFFKKYKINYFDFKVRISKSFFTRMIKNRFTSCLLNISDLGIKKGINEINEKYKKKLIFVDRLICISYQKK